MTEHFLSFGIHGASIRSFMSNSLPIVIQNIVFRRHNEKLEVLVLKRSKERGGFWNVVNGTLELAESIVECRARELFEEIGVHNVVRWGDEVYRFHFPYKDYVVVVLVYSVEITDRQSVVLNAEHTEFRWVCFDDAIEMMKFDNDKKGLRICFDTLSHSES